jgi:hypothetical protein
MFIFIWLGQQKRYCALFLLVTASSNSAAILWATVSYCYCQNVHLQRYIAHQPATLCHWQQETSQCPQTKTHIQKYIGRCVSNGKNELPLFWVWGRVICWGTMPQAGRLWVRFLIKIFEFFSIYLNLPVAPLSWVPLPRIFLWVKSRRSVRLITDRHLPVACLEECYPAMLVQVPAGAISLQLCTPKYVGLYNSAYT